MWAKLTSRCSGGSSSGGGGGVLQQQRSSKAGAGPAPCLRRLSLSDALPSAPSVSDASASSSSSEASCASVVMRDAAAAAAADHRAAADNHHHAAAASAAAAAAHHLKRASMPAMHLGEPVRSLLPDDLLTLRGSVDSSAAIMRNPPLFHNPLRRRGCCDHAHSETMSDYRREAILRDLTARRNVETAAATAASPPALCSGLRAAAAAGGGGGNDDAAA